MHETWEDICHHLSVQQGRDHYKRFAAYKQHSLTGGPLYEMPGSNLIHEPWNKCTTLYRAHEAPQSVPSVRTLGSARASSVGKGEGQGSRAVEPNSYDSRTAGNNEWYNNTTRKPLKGER
jgi:hypothetical protein